MYGIIKITKKISLKYCFLNKQENLMSYNEQIRSKSAWKNTECITLLGSLNSWQFQGLEQKGLLRVQGHGDELWLALVH